DHPDDLATRLLTKSEHVPRGILLRHVPVELKALEVVLAAFGPFEVTRVACEYLEDGGQVALSQRFELQLLGLHRDGGCARLGNELPTCTMIVRSRGWSSKSHSTNCCQVPVCR